MNLGQTLIAILALVLLVTIAVNINRARLSAIAATVDNLVDQEALNFGQSILELVSRRAQTNEGYDDLEEIFVGDGTTPFRQETFDSGRTLYAFVDVEFVDEHETTKPYRHKQVTVSVYTDPNRDNIRSQYSAGLIPWWRHHW